MARSQEEQVLAQLDGWLVMQNLSRQESQFVRILARSWNSNSARPIPVHVAQFESQPAGQEENMILITSYHHSGMWSCTYGCGLSRNWDTKEYKMYLLKNFFLHVAILGIIIF